ncbi:hypothetical protein Ga0100231_014675 [Opitutaceae bacterium TAV4]|nr:hypothetical protein Ga0100231_014675 [Opitutaceae bacterium TAV4]
MPGPGRVNHHIARLKRHLLHAALPFPTAPLNPGHATPRRMENDLNTSVFVKRTIIPRCHRMPQPRRMTKHLARAQLPQKRPPRRTSRSPRHACIRVHFHASLHVRAR